MSTLPLTMPSSICAPVKTPGNFALFLAFAKGRDLCEHDLGDEFAQRPRLAVLTGIWRECDRPIAEERFLAAQDFGVDC